MSPFILATVVIVVGFLSLPFQAKLAQKYGRKKATVPRLLIADILVSIPLVLILLVLLWGNIINSLSDSRLQIFFIIFIPVFFLYRSWIWNQLLGESPNKWLR
jgi:MFS family permease